MNSDELKKILASHLSWIENTGGECADLSCADLSGADLSCAILSGADLRDADLSNADLHEADLNRANLSSADLRDADLSCADLSGADLSCAILSGADLRDADLGGADLSGADLSCADLSGADLSCADLSGADLSGAILSGADLSGADLRDADLSCAILSGAKIPSIKRINIDAVTLDALHAEENVLNMFIWHGCGTTHCRGGWAVTLHPDGKELEEKLGTNAAASLIHAACHPELRVPNWYATEDEAMADMVLRAAAYISECPPTSGDPGLWPQP